MAWIDPRPNGYLVRWREPRTGKVRSERRRTKQEARQLKAEVESSILRGAYVAKDLRQTPFAEYAKSVLDSDWSLAPRTRDNYDRCLRLQLAPLADVPIEHVDASRVRKLFGDLKEAGASAHTLQMTRKTLSKVCSVALEDGILSRNPAKAVRAPQAGPRTVQPLTPQQVAAAAQAVKPRWRVAVLLAAWGGLRVGEIGGLHRDDIDWDRGSIRIQRSASENGLKEAKTKASNRVITFPGWLMTDLRKHVLEYASPEGWLFLTAQGSHLHHLNGARIIRPAGVRWHDLRHTQATLLISLGAHPKEIQARMGHASITTTMNLYGHLVEQAHDELARRLERFDPGEMGKVIELD